MPKTKNKPNKKQAGWKYFDDCLICKAMEKAEKQGRDLSETELKDAFRLASEYQQKKGN